MEISAEDAASLGIAEGDLVRVDSTARLDRGARTSHRESAAAIVFIPFHYGAWISPNQRGDRTRARVE